MKTKQVLYTLLLSVSLLFNSCIDQDEVHAEFVSDADIIYTNIISDLEAFSGNLKAKLTGTISDANNVTEIVVEWTENNELKSKIYTYSKGVEMDFATPILLEDGTVGPKDLVTFIIDSLQEQPYIFNVYSKDSEGNKSVLATTDVEVYGNTYNDRLEARLHNTNYPAGYPLGLYHKFIFYVATSELMRDTEIEFTNINGELNTMVLSRDDASFVTEIGVDLTKPMRYRTGHLPNNTAFEQFYTEWAPLVYVPITPIFMLVSSLGWDDSSFITLTPIEPGVYSVDNISMKQGDSVRFFQEPSLASEIQWGFDYFNDGGSFPIFADTADGNDNLVLDELDSDFDFMVYTDAKKVLGTGPYQGVPLPIPGIIEAEDYNVGGQDAGYNDNPGNSGGQYRDEGVDIGGGGLTNGFNVGWTGNGEWLKYTVNVAESGMYHVNFSMSSPKDEIGQLVLEVYGEDVLTFQGIFTDGWGNFDWFNGGDIHLEAGKAIITIKMVDPNMNWDSMIFTKI